MSLEREVLDAAVARGELSAAQAGALLEALAERRRLAVAAAAEPVRWPRLAGGLALALGCGLAVVVAFDRLGFPGLAGAAAALGLALLGAGQQRFARTGGARGQTLLCAAVLLAPLAAHGLARSIGHGRPFASGPGDLLDWLAGPWFPVQAALALAAGLGLRAFRIPFLAWPLATAAWFAVQDAAPLLFGGPPGWDQRALLSALTGLVLLAAGLALDRRTRGDVAFWVYLPGLLAFTGGLITWGGASDLSVALVAVLHLALLGASLLLERRTFAVAGALGLAAAAGRLADDLLDGAVLSLALAGVGLATVGLGLLYHQRRAWLQAALGRRLPAGVRHLLPPGAPGAR